MYIWVTTPLLKLYMLKTRTKYFLIKCYTATLDGEKDQLENLALWKAVRCAQ